MSEDRVSQSEPEQLPEEIEIVSLRENMISGRGKITDLSTMRLQCMQPPSLIVGDVTRELMQSYFGHVLVLGTSIYRVPNCEVAAEGIVLTEGRFNWCDQLNIDAQYSARQHHGLPARLKTMERRIIEDEVVLITGNGHRMYGHWIIDYLPKLYLLQLDGYKLNRLRFLLPADTPEFARHWLRLLGIDDRQFIFYDRMTDLLTCRMLVVPTGLRFLSRVSPLLANARAFLLENFQPKRFRWMPRVKKGTPYQRIFVARSENSATFNKRRLIQRAELEAKAVVRGFEIVHPELLSVADQVALFQSSNVVCGEYGSGLHASLFCEPGTMVLAVRSNKSGLGFVQSSIDQAVGHENGYVIGGSPDEIGNFSVHREDIDMGFDWLDWKSVD